MKLTAPFIALSTLLLVSFSDAQAEERAAEAPQYRFRNRAIPGATAAEPIRKTFSSAAVKGYLDLGVTLWASQKKCVSCHTHGIHMITRPALSTSWGKPAEDLRIFVVGQANLLIENGNDNGSAPAKMAYIARGLAEWDAQFHDSTSPETDTALRHLLTLQSKDGSIGVQYRWPPLNSDSYHATIMAAMGFATAPLWQSSLQDDQLVARIENLNSFLRETPPKNDHQRILLLWASTRVTGLIDDDRKRQFTEMIWRQQRDDGGWSIRTFAKTEELGGGKRAEKLRDEPNFSDPESDGYQTGLAIVVLRDAGVPMDDPRIQKAVKWLLSNQRESGRWWTPSLNVDSRFHYITYSGTAYAALALQKCDSLPSAD